MEGTNEKKSKKKGIFQKEKRKINVFILKKKKRKDKRKVLSWARFNG